MSTPTDTDFDIRPATADPELLHEIVDGEWVERESSGAQSSFIARQIFRALDAHVATHGLGQVVQKRRPNVAFVSVDRLPPGQPIPAEGDLEFAPDLAIEVLSPKDRDRDVDRKLREYFQAGATRAWVVRPGRRTIAVHRSPTRLYAHEEHEEVDCGPEIPGRRLRVGSVFPPFA